jgi:hypothetical protein
MAWCGRVDYSLSYFDPPTRTCFAGKDDVQINATSYHKTVLSIFIFSVVASSMLELPILFWESDQQLPELEQTNCSLFFSVMGTILGEVEK